MKWWWKNKVIIVFNYLVYLLYYQDEVGHVFVVALVDFYASRHRSTRCCRFIRKGAVQLFISERIISFRITCTDYRRGLLHLLVFQFYQYCQYYAEKVF